MTALVRLLQRHWQGRRPQFRRGHGRSLGAKLERIRHVGGV